MRAWLALLLVVPLLSGCLSFLDNEEDDGREVRPADDVDDPSAFRVTGIRMRGDPVDPRNQLTIPGHDGVGLSTLIYEPLSQDAGPDGRGPTWPVVVFLHGWGMTKEMWACAPLGEPAQPAGPTDPCPLHDLLERFALRGFIAVAYDARGFGRSGGQSTVAGPAEMADLAAVIAYVKENLPTNGKVGVTGISYGGGQSLLAWATNPDITTAVPHQPWYDLYEALLPGNTPKAEWAAVLVGEGTVGAGGRLHPMVYDWADSALQRQGLAAVEADLDARSAMGRMEKVDKPLFVCDAMHDSLFTQTDDVQAAARGFFRAYVHEGGHGTLDEPCWTKTLAWFEFFLRGVDTKVDAWPVLETVDITGGEPVRYRQAPATEASTYYLRAPQLTMYAGSNMTFQIQNQGTNNPFQEPSVVWDAAGQMPGAIPYNMRQDPTAVFFESSAFKDTHVLLGSAKVDLMPAGADAAWQVTGQLIHVLPDGSSRTIARGAYSNVPGQTPALEGPATLDFSFVKAVMDPGSKLVLKLGANDLSWFAPYPGPFTAQFSGHSTLETPYFVG